MKSAFLSTLIFGCTQSKKLCIALAMAGGGKRSFWGWCSLGNVQLNSRQVFTLIWCSHWCECRIHQSCWSCIVFPRRWTLITLIFIWFLGFYFRLDSFYRLDSSRSYNRNHYKIRSIWWLPFIQLSKEFTKIIRSNKKKNWYLLCGCKHRKLSHF